MSKAKPSKKASTKQASNLVDDLRTAILNSDLSRYEIARRADVSESALSYFVNGQRSITLDTAAKVANVLGLQLK